MLGAKPIRELSCDQANFFATYAFLLGLIPWTMTAASSMPGFFPDQSSNQALGVDADDVRQLAQQLFDYEGVRVLLLSATPYKLFTVAGEAAVSGDDHYKDFLSTTRFLLKEKPERIATIESAFRQLIERHQHAVIGTVARMLNDAHEAEDIAQQVFVRLWNSAPKWRPEAKFTTYLYTIMRNLVFNESRRRSRKKEISLDEQEENHPAAMRADGGLSPDEGMEKRELHRSIDAAIAALPEQQRLAVVLRTFEGLDYDGIVRKSAALRILDQTQRSPRR